MAKYIDITSKFGTERFSVRQIIFVTNTGVNVSIIKHARGTATKYECSNNDNAELARIEIQNAMYTTDPTAQQHEPDWNTVPVDITKYQEIST